MGQEELWLPLAGSKVKPAEPEKASSASAAPEGSEPTTKATMSEENLGASSGSLGDRAPLVPDRRAAVPASSSPMRASNYHVNGAGFRGRQNARFAPHPHGRGGGGGRYNNGTRRPVGGANGGSRGDVNVHVHINGNGYGNLYNNRQRRGGRSHPNAHWHGQGHGPSGPQMARTNPYPQPPPPPFMVPPPMAYYNPYYEYDYPSHGYYFPPAQEGLPFMPYPTLPMPMMPPHLEHQGAAFGPASMEQQQQEAPQRDAPAPLTAEELQKSIRTQIEYYFSTNNLITDIYLRGKMDSEGWVPLTVIANFPLIKAKSDDLDFIVTSVLPSDEVEVQDGKIRRRIGWEKYPLQARSN